MTIDSQNPEPLSVIISTAVRRASRLFVAAVIVAFLIIETLVVRSEFESSRQKLREWISLNQPQIEQAIFLENSLSIQGLLQGFLDDASGASSSRGVGIFGNDRQRLRGELLFRDALPEGFSRELFPPRIVYFSPLRFGGQRIGSLLIHERFNPWGPALHTFLAAIACWLVVFLFRILLRTLVRRAKQQAVLPLLQLKDAMRGFDGARGFPRLHVAESGLAAEVREVFLGFNAMSETMEAYARREGAAAAVLAQKDLAAQVAHDIRSPLASLRLSLQELPGVPEDRRQAAGRALNRISDIAQQLISAYHQERAGETLRTVSAPATAVVRPELLSECLAEVVSEKRIQLRGRLDLALEFSGASGEGYGLFAAIEGPAFKRAVSNLLDNAADAIEGSGRVRVHLRSEEEADRVQIVIEDSGKGIPAEVLPRLGERGLSVGKSGGSGLGISYVREAVARWGGTVDFVSPVNGGGTRVSILLPCAARPDWFAHEAVLVTGSTVIVADDDESIHRLWEQRLADRVARGELRIEHYATLAELRERATRERPRSARAAEVYLVDYDFSGKHAADAGENGLDMIERLRIGAQSYLVTSHSEDFGIRSKATELAVRIIPKSLAAWVPLRG